MRAFGGIFVATMVLYVTLYGGCEAIRSRGGPWVVFQEKAADGTPVVRLEHHKLLAAGPVTLTFPGEQAPARFTNSPYMRIFRTPNTNTLPYGNVVFVDIANPTGLPGTVVMDVFGHLLEIQPHQFFLDGHAVAWVPGTNIVVPTTGKLPLEQRPQRKPR